nr:MAG TPA: hypothetical protein [Bacteriophage sp.]
MKKVVDSDKDPRLKFFLFDESQAIHDSITRYLSKREV